MTYLPEVIMDDTDIGTVWSDKKHMGTIIWNGIWGCYIYTPAHHTHYGPAFLAGLAAVLVKMEAKRRKGQP
jgi:hypothetical protein